MHHNSEGHAALLPSTDLCPTDLCLAGLDPKRSAAVAVPQTPSIWRLQACCAEEAPVAMRMERIEARPKACTDAKCAPWASPPAPQRCERRDIATEVRPCRTTRGSAEARTRLHMQQHGETWYSLVITIPAQPCERSCTAKWVRILGADANTPVGSVSHMERML